MEDEESLDSMRTTIDPDGNLVLVVDDHELLVSRDVLCLSSSVFRAMLRKGSPFLESTKQVISSDGLTYIHLGDDNYEVMRIVASAIHLQHDMVPMKVPFEVLDSLATICDRYDLRESLGLWPQKLSEGYIDSVTEPGNERWLFIAMVFRNAAIFSEITRRLMLITTISENGDLQFQASFRLAKVFLLEFSVSPSDRHHFAELALICQQSK